MMVHGHVKGATGHGGLLLLDRHDHSGRDGVHTDPTAASLVARSLKGRALLEGGVSTLAHHGQMSRMLLLVTLLADSRDV